VRVRPRDIAPTAGALAVVALVALRDSAIWAWMERHAQGRALRALVPLREGWKLPLYELGSGQYLLPLAGVVYAAGRLSRNADLRDAGLGCAAGHLSTLGTRLALLQVVARARPSVAPEPFHFAFPGSGDWLRQSFISGHSANSMACASFLSHRLAFGVAEALPYAYSAAIGIGRMADGHHWASDNVAGALIGFAIGRMLAEKSLRRP
jgi:membrane-associated phospholipid phosphatase